MKTYIKISIITTILLGLLLICSLTIGVWTNEIIIQDVIIPINKIQKSLVILIISPGIIAISFGGTSCETKDPKD